MTFTPPHPWRSHTCTLEEPCDTRPAPGVIVDEAGRIDALLRGGLGSELEQAVRRIAAGGAHDRRIVAEDDDALPASQGKPLPDIGAYAALVVTSLSRHAPLAPSLDSLLRDALDNSVGRAEQVERARATQEARAAERATAPRVELTLDRLLDALPLSREYAEHLVQPYCTCAPWRDEVCEHARDEGVEW